MSDAMNKRDYEQGRKFRSLLLLLCLSACSSIQEEPVGVGSGTDDLKRSPCANCESDDDQEPFYVNGRWVI